MSAAPYDERRALEERIAGEVITHGEPAVEALAGQLHKRHFTNALFGDVVAAGVSVYKRGEPCSRTAIIKHISDGEAANQAADLIDQYAPDFTPGAAQALREDARRLRAMAGDTPRVVKPSFTPGDEFILDTPAVAEPVWGRGAEVIWSRGEPWYLVGPPGVGKTSVLQQVALAMVGVRGDVLDYPVREAKRVLYVAADRPRQAQRSFARMVRERHRGQLRDRVAIHRGPLPFDLVKTPELFVEWVDGFDAVFVDSLKDVARELTKDEVGSAVNDAFQRVVAADIDLAVNHHQRKAIQGGAKPRTLSDVYGSAWLTAGAGSVVCLWGDAGDPIVVWDHLKQPVEPVGPFSVRHDHTAGRSYTDERPDPLAFLQNAGAKGVTPKMAAEYLYDKSDRAAVEKARRVLQRLERDGFATTEVGGKGSGNTSIWFAIRNHGGNHGRVLPAQSTTASGKSRRGSTSGHVQITDITAPGVTVSPPSLEGGNVTSDVTNGSSPRQSRRFGDTDPPDPASPWLGSVGADADQLPFAGEDARDES